MLYAFFIFLQIILLLFITLHDWIEVKPFTDLATVRKHHSLKNIFLSSFLYALIVFIPLMLTILYPNIPLWVAIQLVVFYSLTTVGTICSWWIPYFLGSSDDLKQKFAIFNNTHRFLPARGDNIVPDTLHVILHIQVWVCCIISWYYLFARI